ncbi:hypothetical protein FHU14_005005, partial [Mesorhizobium sp. RMAD-H1]|nr:hypothetical protein [Mesorhizobium sp. RMAD-H1]
MVTLESTRTFTHPPNRLSSVRRGKFLSKRVRQSLVRAPCEARGNSAAHVSLSSIFDCQRTDTSKCQNRPDRSNLRPPLSQPPEPQNRAPSGRRLLVYLDPLVNPFFRSQPTFQAFATRSKSSSLFRLLIVKPWGLAPPSHNQAFTCLKGELFTRQRRRRPRCGAIYDHTSKTVNRIMCEF